MTVGMVLMFSFLQMVSSLVSVFLMVTCFLVSSIRSPETMVPSFMVTAMDEYPGVSLALGSMIDSSM